MRISQVLLCEASLKNTPYATSSMAGDNLVQVHFSVAVNMRTLSLSLAILLLKLWTKPLDATPSSISLISLPQPNNASNPYNLTLPKPLESATSSFELLSKKPIDTYNSALPADPAYYPIPRSSQALVRNPSIFHILITTPSNRSERTDRPGNRSSWKFLLTR